MTVKTTKRKKQQLNKRKAEREALSVAQFHKNMVTVFRRKSSAAFSYVKQAFLPESVQFLVGGGGTDLVPVPTDSAEIDIFYF